MGKVYAYNVSDKSRDPSRDYELATVNTHPTGIWSNGSTIMYVADNYDRRIYAYHVLTPTLGASGVTANAATLTMTRHDDAWWYQRTTPTGDTTCHSVASGTATASLSTLTVDTSYTYTAYSDSGCAIVLDTVSFTTRLTVGNLSETSHATLSNEVGYKTANNNRRWANAFTTGSAAGGYALHGVTFAFGATTGSPTRVHAKIYADANGLPGTLVKDLGSKNPTSAGNQTWDCTGTGCTLSPDTTYHVALEADASGVSAGHYYDWKVTASANQTNTPGDAGWTLADYGTYKTNQGAWAAYGDEAGKFALSATALPGLAVSNVTATTATFTLSDYSGAWWLKRTSPAGGTCEPAGTATTKTVTTPTTSQTYTYKVYRAGGCADSDEIATLTFTAIRMAASSITHTSATLTISNHTDNWYVKRTAPTPAGTCSRAIRTTTHGLTNLEYSTTYTYKAYSQSNCASANEIATATFTTIGPGSHNSAKDISSFAIPHDFGPLGMWSDGTTMWVTWYIWSFQQGSVQAYNLSTWNRDTSKEFSLHAASARPFGIWGNASTIWVADHKNTYVYAYTRATGARDTTKEFDLHADNGQPYGIWSDGTTMWVADGTDAKLYAYNLSDGTRDAAKDYATLSAAGNASQR